MLFCKIDLAEIECNVSTGNDLQKERVLSELILNEPVIYEEAGSFSIVASILHRYSATVGHTNRGHVFSDLKSADYY